MNIVSLFSGAGGLDLGFRQVGFNIIWANEYNKDIWETYIKNHPKTVLDKRSIVNINISEVPNCDGIIGGPPCQSWSVAGVQRGFNDTRGQLFFDFLRVLEAKQPKFFLVENVSGMLLLRHKEALNNIKKLLKNTGIGYRLSFKLLNASNYNISQDRKRVFFIGIRKDLDFKFVFPDITFPKITLKESIGDLRGTAIPALKGNYTNGENCKIVNHEYIMGSYSSRYMSRNRVRTWDEQSFTIQAGGRYAPIHPQAPKMSRITKDKRIFALGKEELYRRLSIRECARIQTFPDDFVFYYNKVTTGYKMVGNAVPINLAKFLAESIKNQFLMHYPNNFHLY